MQSIKSLLKKNAAFGFQLACFIVTKDGGRNVIVGDPDIQLGELLASWLVGCVTSSAFIRITEKYDIFIKTEMRKRSNTPYTSCDFIADVFMVCQCY